MNRLLMEELAAMGHVCHAIVPSSGSQALADHQAFRSELSRRSIPYDEGAEADTFLFNRVTVHAAREKQRAESLIARLCETLAPDWVLVASEDPGQHLLALTLRQTESVIYLARTTLALPFGPSSALPSRTRTELLRRVHKVIVVSEYLQRYFEEWASISSVLMPISPTGPGPFPYLGSFDNQYVTLINPCLFKGLSIFVALARALPRVQFAAVPTWGSTRDDIRQLSELPNVTLLAASDNIVEVLRQTRVLLFPSLWAEAHGMTIIEAMLHGIPVVASAVGGIPEAKLGVDHLVPVIPITNFTGELDERMLPVPVIEKQDMLAWINTVAQLTSDRAAYVRLSSASRQAAMAFHSSQATSTFSEHLEEQARLEFSPALTGH